MEEHRPEKRVYKTLPAHLGESLCVSSQQNVVLETITAAGTDARVLSEDRFSSPAWKDSFTKTLKGCLYPNGGEDGRGVGGGALPHFTPLARIHFDAVMKLYKRGGDQNEGRVQK